MLSPAARSATHSAIGLLRGAISSLLEVEGGADPNQGLLDASTRVDAAAEYITQAKDVMSPGAQPACANSAIGDERNAELAVV